MRISELYHVISEVESQSRRVANNKFQPQLRRLEREKNKLGIQMLNLMQACVSPLDSVELHLADKSRILNLTSQFASINEHQHEIYEKIGDEAERVAQMLLKKRGIEISVKDTRNGILPELVEVFDLEDDLKLDDDLELEIRDTLNHSR